MSLASSHTQGVVAKSLRLNLITSVQRSGGVHPNKTIRPTIAPSSRLYSTSKASASKRPRVHNSSGSVEGVWFTSKGAPNKSLDMGQYGLSRLNYATLEPPVWTVPPHPPTKSVIERVIFPLTIVLTGCVIVWAYMNPEEDDMNDYWKRVETGQILIDDDDDDDDEDWDDDDDDDDN